MIRWNLIFKYLNLNFVRNYIEISAKKITLLQNFICTFFFTFLHFKCILIYKIILSLVNPKIVLLIVSYIHIYTYVSFVMLDYIYWRDNSYQKSKPPLCLKWKRTYVLLMALSLTSKRIILYKNIYYICNLGIILMFNT